MLYALILYVSSGTYSLTSSPKDSFFKTFSWQVYLLSQFLPEICWEEIVQELFFIFHFVDGWPGIRTQANKPTHYILDHGDILVTNFIVTFVKKNLRAPYFMMRMKINSNLTSEDKHQQYIWSQVMVDRKDTCFFIKFFQNINHFTQTQLKQINNMLWSRHGLVCSVSPY